MESKGKNNVEKNSDENINKKAKAHDLLKRVGKTVSWGGLGVLSVAGVALGIGSASLVGYAIAATCVPIYAFSSTRAIVNVIYKTEPDLLFMIKSSKGKKEISQDTRFLEIYKNLRRYKTRKKEILKSLDEGIIEKKFNSSKEKEEYVDKKISAETNQRIAGLMTLQTLVGFSRIKDNLKGSKYEVLENGQKLYNQKFSTETHGLNIKTFEILEDMGYIKIDNIDDKIKKSKNKLLLKTERFGMGNFGELKKISRLEKETKSGNQKAKEELEKMKVAIKNVEFRFTDKKIDLEELYKENVIDKKSSRIGFIFNKNYGILSSNNIDIKKDRFGRDVIDYSAKNSFVNRVNKKYNDELRKSEKSNEKFNQELQRGVNEISVENREEQSEKSIEENLVVK